jgi:hypothetical protein
MPAGGKVCEPTYSHSDVELKVRAIRGHPKRKKKASKPDRPGLRAFLEGIKGRIDALSLSSLSFSFVRNAEKDEER